MKIKNKLYLGFGIILVQIIVLLAILMYMLNQLNLNMYKVVQEQYEIVRLTSVIRFEINNIGREVRGISASPPKEFKPKIMENIEQSHQNTKLALEALKNINTRAKTQELVLKLILINEKYNDLLEQTITLVNAGQKPEVIADKPTPLYQLIWYDGRLVREQMFQVIDELMVVEEQAMQVALNQSSTTYNLAVKVIYTNVIAGLLIVLGVTFWVVRSITGKLNKVTSVLNKVAYSATDQLPRIEINTKDEIADIALAFNRMAQNLEEQAKNEKELKEAAQEQSWLKTRVAEIAIMYPGAKDLQTLAKLFISQITPKVGASYGVFYLIEEHGDQERLIKLATYAYNNQEIGSEDFRLGEGLVGQCGLENKMIILNQVPDNYIKITSGLGTASPASIIVLPVEFEGQVLAVIELASFDSFSSLQQTLLQQVLSNLGIIIKNIKSNMHVKILLKESQALTEELQTQSEELQIQQEELRTTIEKIEEEHENSEMKARELENTKQKLEEKARQLELNSKYKSQFLANMSHELRTPLNSLLILAQMFAENTNGNLTSKQVEYAKTIYSSGDDLLKLINDILDLAKVEAGKIDINPSEVILSDIKDFVENQFRPVARRKEIKLITQVDADLPKTIYSDVQRIKQILTNLLSNAFKFIERGSVTLHIHKAEQEVVNKLSGVNSEDLIVAISVTDTGIGIPPEKQSVIFKAFRQADGTTSRKYGGTGLGLTISRVFAHLLGGFIDVESDEGKGSTFTLYLPNYHGKKVTEDRYSEAEVAATHTEGYSQSEEEFHQSYAIQHGEAMLECKKILIVDDDMRNVFALTAALESQQLEVLFAENGREGIAVLGANPDIDLILMDIMMPEMDGYEAMGVIRQMPEYQKLPIIALTAKAMKNDRELCIQAGASDYISKPVNLEQLFSLLRVWLYNG